jgi:transposase
LIDSIDVPHGLVARIGLRIGLVLRGSTYATSLPCRVSKKSCRAGAGRKPITSAAVELGVSAAAIHNWIRQDQIDRGERPGITTPESIELAKAKKRIRQLEEEVEILKIAATLLGEVRPRPKGFTR